MTGMADHPLPDSARAAGRRTPPTWAVLLAVCAGQFLVVLDVSVVNVALPSMREDLALSATGLQWVVNAYSIAFAGFMLFGGRAGDLFGRKRMFLVGLAVFTAASLAGEWPRKAGNSSPPAPSRVWAPPSSPRPP